MRTIVVSTLALAAAACGGNPTTQGPAPTSGTVYLWISADQDTYTKCSVAAECNNGDQNHPFQGELQVANEPAVELKRAYLHFTLPTLPAGSEVLRAHLEVYNGAKNGDGRSDDVCLGITTLGESWSPFALTWDEQPVDQALSGEHGLSFRSQAWTTGDVLDAVQEHFANPSKNYGFAITVPPNTELDKAFYSLNAPSRTESDMGLAPRLLIEVKLGPGNDPIVWPSNVAADSDLPFPGKNVLMARTAVGDDFPEEWEPAIYEDRCN